jgi:uncharacterized membrane protein
MKGKHENTFLCPICGEQKSVIEQMHGDIIHESIKECILKKHPEWSTTDVICLACLNRFRADYIEDVLETDKGELSSLEQELVESLRNEELISTDINAEFDKQLTFGERMADRIAAFGGSWYFLGIFSVVIIFWMVLNTIFLMKKPFDPYPFILLNLVLSCLAAVQAPVILMSQNREEAKDRMRSESDYRINLKAELGVRHLHAKMDQLLSHQWRRLLEIQKIQMEIMEEFIHKSPGKRT